MLQTFFRSTKWCHGEMNRNAFSHENRNRPKWKHFQSYSHVPSKPSNVKGMISVRRLQFCHSNELWTAFFLSLSLDHFMQVTALWLLATRLTYGIRSFPKGIRFLSIRTCWQALSLFDRCFNLNTTHKADSCRNIIYISTFVDPSKTNWKKKLVSIFCLMKFYFFNCFMSSI